MISLGVSGSFDRVEDVTFSHLPVHNSSATLVKDGVVLAAVEEERLDRWKHSGKLPVGAIRFCLETAGLTLQDVDAFVVPHPEEAVNDLLTSAYQAGRMPELQTVRPFLQRILGREFNQLIPTDRFEFIDHHYAHAASAFFVSDFPESLVVTLDGVGSGASGTVWLGGGGDIKLLQRYDGRIREQTQSLGHFYLGITKFLGFDHFDEYKVMGLAPYGKRSSLRSVFERLYTLGDRGQYQINLSRFDDLLDVCPPRRKGEEIQQVHTDIAAAAQEVLETVAFHVLEYYRRESKSKRLCLAGGVAQNCVLNGKILQSGLFEHVFVQPAAHDGGLSLGAAIHGARGTLDKDKYLMSNAYLGPTCGQASAITAELDRWDKFVKYERTDDVSEAVGELLAGGTIVAWVQDRCEFGPRALGNRSILADPRPAVNKTVINALIKKREGFRPFAPSVLEEAAAEYFEIPPHVRRLPYMVFTVKVREQYRELLGAITHVDGTARIQTVSKADNERYWNVIDAFGRRTGTPIVLNTSFNNSSEPIVTTVHDALVTLLTTDLPVLAVGDFIVRKQTVGSEAFTDLRLELPRGSTVYDQAGAGSGPSDGQPDSQRPLFQRLVFGEHSLPPGTRYCVVNTHDARREPLSDSAAELLMAANRQHPIGHYMEGKSTTQREQLLGELLELWRRRVIRLAPL